MQYCTKHLTKHSDVLYALPLHHCQSKYESWCLLLSVNICIAYGHVAMIIETMSIYITIESTYDVYASTTRPYPILLHSAQKWSYAVKKICCDCSWLVFWNVASITTSASSNLVRIYRMTTFHLSHSIRCNTIYIYTNRQLRHSQHHAGGVLYMYSHCEFQQRTPW